MRKLSVGLFVVGWLVACGGSDDATSSSSSDGGTTTTPGADAGSATGGDAGTTTPTPVACASPPCADGDSCVTATDCKSGVCNSNTCVAAACADGVKNGQETDVDCGGACLSACGPTKGCAVNEDCLDKVCTASGTCKPPTSADGIKNGNETDVDCGSSTTGRFDTKAARCDFGKSCVADADCKSAGCNLTTHTCAYARSCATTNGGTTCGAGDSTSATNLNEDCCTSAEVPVYTNGNFTNGTKFRLDKYTITAGRMRRFLDAVNGNVQGWVQANRANILAPTQLPAALDKYLPKAWVQPDEADGSMCGTGVNGDLYPCNYGAIAHMSGYRYNNEPGGVNGYACAIETGGYGARTFHLTDAELAAFYTDPDFREKQHTVPAERLAQKALNCVDYFMLAAFCAWDGGRLESYGEYNGAYGGDGANGNVYPWGSEAATRPLGFADALNSNLAPTYNYVPPAWPEAGDGETAYSVFNPNLSPAEKGALLTRLNRANAFWNYANYITSKPGFFQALGATEQSYVAAEDIDEANDQSVAVAPPGRYTAGRGKYGHSDLIGNLIEITATPASGTGPVAGTNQVWARNGSYETAHFNQQTMTGGSYQKALLTKYGRAGGRCARPAGIYPTTILP